MTDKQEKMKRLICKKHNIYCDAPSGAMVECSLCAYKSYREREKEILEEARQGNFCSCNEGGLNLFYCKHCRKLLEIAWKTIMEKHIEDKKGSDGILKKKELKYNEGYFNKTKQNYNKLGLKNINQLNIIDKQILKNEAINWVKEILNDIEHENWLIDKYYDMGDSESYYNLIGFESMIDALKLFFNITNEDLKDYKPQIRQETIDVINEI